VRRRLLGHSHCEKGDANYVDCVGGVVRQLWPFGKQSCAVACDGSCCIGEDACFNTNACIKKDGSCIGKKSCANVGQASPMQPELSGPKCQGEKECYENPLITSEPR
jgi:hypothetical protein